MVGVTALAAVGHPLDIELCHTMSLSYSPGFGHSSAEGWEECVAFSCLYCGQCCLHLSEAYLCRSEECPDAPRRWGKWQRAFSFGQQSLLEKLLLRLFLAVPLVMTTLYGWQSISFQQSGLCIPLSFLCPLWFGKSAFSPNYFSNIFSNIISVIFSAAWATGTPGMVEQWTAVDWALVLLLCG